MAADSDWPDHGARRGKPAGGAGWGSGFLEPRGSGQGVQGASKRCDPCRGRKPPRARTEWSNSPRPPPLLPREVRGTAGAGGGPPRNTGSARLRRGESDNVSRLELGRLEVPYPSAELCGAMQGVAGGAAPPGDVWAPPGDVWAPRCGRPGGAGVALPSEAARGAKWLPRRSLRRGGVPLAPTSISESARYCCHGRVELVAWPRGGGNPGSSPRTTRACQCSSRSCPWDGG